MVRQSLGGGEVSLIFSLLWVSRVGESGEGLGITNFLSIPDLTDVYKRQVRTQRDIQDEKETIS